MGHEIHGKNGVRGSTPPHALMGDYRYLVWHRTTLYFSLQQLPCRLHSSLKCRIIGAL